MNQEEFDAFDLVLGIDVHLSNLFLSIGCAARCAWWLKLSAFFGVGMIRLHFFCCWVLSAVCKKAQYARNKAKTGAKLRQKTNSKCGLP